MSDKVAIKADELGENTGFLEGIGIIKKNNKRTFDKLAGKKYEYSEKIKENRNKITYYENEFNKLKLEKDEYYKELTKTIKEDRKLIKNKLDELNLEHKNTEKKIEQLEKKFETGDSQILELEKEKEEKKQYIKNNPLDRKSRQRINEIDLSIKALKEQAKTKSREYVQEISPLKSKLSEIIYKEYRLNEEYEKIKIINNKTLENHPRNNSDFDYKINLLKDKIKLAKNENIEIEKRLKEIIDLSDYNDKNDNDDEIIDLTEDEKAEIDAYIQKEYGYEKEETNKAGVSFADLIQHSGGPTPKQIKYNKSNKDLKNNKK